MFVKHPTQPAWGTGKVLELVPPDKARIRFAGGGEKLLQLSMASLEPATPSPDEEGRLARSGTGPRPRLPANSQESLAGTEAMPVLMNNCNRHNHAEVYGPGAF